VASMVQNQVQEKHQRQNSAKGDYHRRARWISILTLKMTSNADTSVPIFVAYITEPWDRLPGRS
jgi:hypothetical protein